MSRILSALRKSEVRRAGTAPTHSRIAFPPGAPTPGRRVGTRIPISLAAIAAVASLGAALYSRTDEPATPGAGATPQNLIPRAGFNGAAAAAGPQSIVELANLHIDVLVYTENPASRFVLINMQRFGEGDLLAPETRIEEITASEVIVRHRGTRLRLAPRSL